MLQLFLAEFRRLWIEFCRYPIEAIARISVTTAFFYTLFLGISNLAGSTLQLGDRLDSVVVGYVLWNLAFFIMVDISSLLQIEAITGTLEQLFLSRYSAIKILLMRLIASLILHMFMISTILFIIMMLTGSRLGFPPSLVFPLMAVVMAASGIAFSFASIALLFKRIQNLQAILQFILLFLLATPAETWTPPFKFWSNFFPMTPAAGLLRDLMVRGVSLNITKLAIAIANGGVYFVLGLTLFYYAEREAKCRGILSRY